MRLVLFDVDGTLCLTGGAGGRAMTIAFEEVFGVCDGFAGIPMPGRTDQNILMDAIKRLAHETDPALESRFRDRYLVYLREEVKESGRGRNGVMPGVRELLDALTARDDVVLGLLTGNYMGGARIKLEHFGLWHYFRCGAFGDDAHERNELVPVAVGRARECGAGEFPPDRVVVIGDTPLDVACARAAGARAIAVATGSSSSDELRESSADVVFEDLSETGAVVRAIVETSELTKKK
jgi:phosphoglycolate phosphatase